MVEMEGEIWKIYINYFTQTLRFITIKQFANVNVVSHGEKSDNRSSPCF